MILILVLIYYYIFGSSLNMIAFTKIMKKFDKVKWWLQMVVSVINQKYI